MIGKFEKLARSQGVVLVSASSTLAKKLTAAVDEQ